MLARPARAPAPPRDRVRSGASTRSPGREVPGHCPAPRQCPRVPRWRRLACPTSLLSLHAELARERLEIGLVAEHLLEQQFELLGPVGLAHEVAQTVARLE